jgi:hypothetical protein
MWYLFSLSATRCSVREADRPESYQGRRIAGTETEMSVRAAPPVRNFTVRKLAEG